MYIVDREKHTYSQYYSLKILLEGYTKDDLETLEKSFSTGLFDLTNIEKTYFLEHEGKQIVFDDFITKCSDNFLHRLCTIEGIDEQVEMFDHDCGYVYYAFIDDDKVIIKDIGLFVKEKTNDYDYR